jgi:hypothetical protein
MSNSRQKLNCKNFINNIKFLSNKYAMNSVKLSFHVLEFVLFIFPVLPNKLSIRLSISFVYFLLHYYKVQNIYSQIKYLYVKDD